MSHDPEDFLEEPEYVELPQGRSEEIHAGLRGDFIDYHLWAYEEGWTPHEVVCLFTNKVLPPPERPKQSPLSELKKLKGCAGRLARRIEDAIAVGELPASESSEHGYLIRPLDALVFVEKHLESINEAEERREVELRERVELEIEASEKRIKDKSLTKSECDESYRLLKSLDAQKKALAGSETGPARLDVKGKFKELILEAACGPEPRLSEDVKANRSKADRLSAAGRKGANKRWGTEEEKARQRKQYQDEALRQLSRHPNLSYPALLKILARIFSITPRRIRDLVTKEWLISRGHFHAEPSSTE